MTQARIAELVESWRPRYLKASHEEKTLILNEFVAPVSYTHLTLPTNREV